MTNLCRHLLVLFIPLAAASAQERPAPVVELYEEISGPAVQTQSLQLLRDGSVVSETYDWATSRGGGPHRRALLCKIDSARVEAILAQAKSAIAVLPRTIDTDAPIPIDGPYQSIRVGADRNASSTLHEPASANSLGAKQFKTKWSELAGRLNCHGPNNSFKPKPLRGSA
jgi:hypothetical protein